jgi:hypothetical protein
VVLANAAHVNNVPGRKTDVNAMIAALIAGETNPAKLASLADRGDGRRTSGG